MRQLTAGQLRATLRAIQYYQQRVGDPPDAQLRIAEEKLSERLERVDLHGKLNRQKRSLRREQGADCT